MFEFEWNAASDKHFSMSNSVCLENFTDGDSSLVKGTGLPARLYFFKLLVWPRIYFLVFLV